MLPPSSSLLLQHTITLLDLCFLHMSRTLALLELLDFATCRPLHMLFFLPETFFSPPHPLSGCFSAFLTLNPRQAPSVCLSIFVLDYLTACAVISNQSQFSLLTVVMFSEAAMNTKLANTEPLLLKGKT